MCTVLVAKNLLASILRGRGLDVETGPRGAPNCHFYVSLCASYSLHVPRFNVVVEDVVVRPGDEWPLASNLLLLVGAASTL